MTSLGDQLTALAREAPMPAVAVVVFTPDERLAEVVHGVADLGTGRPARVASWWDLASLTKVLVTVPEVLDLVARQRIGLDQPLHAAWPAARHAPFAAATVAQLLSYDAGLPATVPFFTGLAGRDAIVEAALRTRLDRPVGSGAVYSDVSFVVLGAMVEALTGRSLAAAALERSGLRYPPLPGAAVATEHCAWRDRLITGEVHDENAAAMGGVAGHAGAFATIGLLARTGQDWLAERVTTAELHRAVRRQWSSNGDGERFGLGWWLTPTRALGGPSAGPAGYGMSGFVGNRIWLEPERGYGVAVLSNRIHPVRADREPFTAWCARLLDLVAAAVRIRSPAPTPPHPTPGR
ncbi:serine hydrolase domain-containing protein [Dactylosporangium siamense]|uniref:Esterase n=1 Tax=Dactylosporangium siamense TaxID=685454 RepID=A0A919PNA3_9ACTN|nr:serine hydrolase domain-containing protein [Dactylosporangium siamense]GIG47895.1 esterase [Dactylosporangium siamense]